MNTGLVLLSLAVVAVAVASMPVASRGLRSFAAGWGFGLGLGSLLFALTAGAS